MKKVGDLTIDEPEDLIEARILEVLGDPDAGLELRDEVKDRLRSSLAAAECGQRLLSMESADRGSCPWMRWPGCSNWTILLRTSTLRMTASRYRRHFTSLIAIR